MKRSHGIAVAVAVVLVGVFGVFWVFGTPQTQVPQAASAPSGVAPVEVQGDLPSTPDSGGMPPQGMGGAGVPAMGGGDPSAIGKEAPPADPDSPLAIQIPGCTCHSDDPKLVEEHAQYRMNQCFGCHSGGSKPE